jgi:hypothetical protein
MVYREVMNVREAARNLLLVAGGIAIIASALFTLSHLTDRVVYTVLVPGVVFGLMLIGIAMSIGGRGWRWFG